MRQPFTGNTDAIWIVIDACKAYRNTVFAAPIVNRQQVISPAAANLTNSNGFFMPEYFFKTRQGNGMATQPGIDKIQLAHVLLYISKWNTGFIQQFFFV